MRQLVEAVESRTMQGGKFVLTWSQPAIVSEAVHSWTGQTILVPKATMATDTETLTYRDDAERSVHLAAINALLGPRLGEWLK